MRGAKKTRAWAAAGALVAVLVFLLLTGCATGGSSSQALNWKQVDPSAFSNRQFNTMGLQTYGPNIRQLYGYVLYPDGVTVTVGGRINGTPLGRMSLADVQQDYQKVLRDNMISGGSLILREVTRSGVVVAYTATQPYLDVTVWDMAPGTPGPAVLQVTFP